MMPVHSEPRPAYVASVPFFEIVECRGFSHCRYDIGSMKPIADKMALDCMGVWMRRANRIVTAIYDEALTHLGVRPRNITG